MLDRFSDFSDDIAISVVAVEDKISICDGQDSMVFTIDEAMWIHDIIRRGLVIGTRYSASLTPGGGKRVVLDYSGVYFGSLFLKRTYSDGETIKNECGMSIALLFYTAESSRRHSETHGYCDENPLRCEVEQLMELIEGALESMFEKKFPIEVD